MAVEGKDSNSMRRNNKMKAVNKAFDLFKKDN